MDFLETVGHAQTLAVDRVDRAPIDGRRARAQLLVDAVAVADALDERQALGQFEPHLGARHAILRCAYVEAERRTAYS